MEAILGRADSAGDSAMQVNLVKTMINLSTGFGKTI